MRSAAPKVAAFSAAPQMAQQMAMSVQSAAAPPPSTGPVVMAEGFGAQATCDSTYADLDAFGGLSTIPGCQGSSTEPL
eukprot:CAMPEP_0174925566 /NCGR_PEP_ID=MMETSP1355-20121228/8005_1 /TAXON_ID=464990 /ORGANISM="Hemiselmis tepida, Strain CCMP443" /LENGTH=77 /DNA_ID=CAMNT_0016171501 /DNA_START=40 /DNA_END=271 /DNA_ORIENTATION=-